MFKQMSIQENLFWHLLKWSDISRNIGYLSDQTRTNWDLHRSIPEVLGQCQLYVHICLPTFLHYTPCPRTLSTVWTRQDPMGTLPSASPVESATQYCQGSQAPTVETMNWEYYPVKIIIWNITVNLSSIFQHVNY